MRLTNRLLTILLGLLLLFGIAANDTTSATPVADNTVADETDTNTTTTVTNTSVQQLAYVIPIRGMITDVTLSSIQRRVDSALTDGATTIVFEMDTPGGMVDSSMKICNLIKGIDIQTLAWVNQEAYSAGAMISIACNGIVMAKRSSMGDCAPIAIGPSGVIPLEKTERAKAESPILAEFRDSATANGYPIKLCEVMVKLGPAVYTVSNTKTGAIRFIYETELPDYGLNKSDLVTGVRREVGPLKEQNDQAKRETIETDWKIIKLANPENELLTLNQDLAVEYGFARAIVDSDAKLMSFLGDSSGRLQRVEMNWSEELAGWLVLPAVKGILMMLFMLGLYMEFQSPGIGLPGGVALLAGLILLGAPYMTGLADIIEIIIILTGLVLLAVEVFVIPGFGVAGFAGVILIFVGLVLTFVGKDIGPGYWPTMPATWDGLATGMKTVLISLIASCFGFYFISKHFGSIPVLNRLLLREKQLALNVAGVGGGVGGGVEIDQVDATGTVRLGDTGIVEMELHPIGRARIDNQLVDVVSAGEWIKEGVAVKVVEIHGNRIIVEEVVS